MPLSDQSDYLNQPNEVGLVHEESFVCQDRFELSNGQFLEGYELRYECYGELNTAKDNAV